MTHRTGFHDGRLGIGLKINGGGDGTGKPRYPLDVNGDIRLSGAIVDSSGNPIQMMAQQRTFPKAITTVEKQDIGDGTVFGASNWETQQPTGVIGLTVTPYNIGLKSSAGGTVTGQSYSHSSVQPHGSFDFEQAFDGGNGGWTTSGSTSDKYNDSSPYEYMGSQVTINIGETKNVTVTTARLQNNNQIVDTADLFIYGVGFVNYLNIQVGDTVTYEHPTLGSQTTTVSQVFTGGSNSAPYMITLTDNHNVTTATAISSCTFHNKKEGLAGSWGQIDIGQNSVISSFSITGNSDYTGRRPSNFYLLGSLDGTNWTTIKHEQNPTYSGHTTTCNLSEVQGLFRYYRITVLNLSGYSDSRVSIDEIELFGALESQTYGGNSVDLYRNSSVTIGDTSADITNKLFVNGNTKIGGDLQLIGILKSGTITSDAIVSKTNTLDNLNVGVGNPTDYTFSVERKIIASDGAANNRFGNSVAINGNYVIVGAHYANKAYIYNLYTGAEIRTLTPPSPDTGQFGVGVGIYGNYAIVGARTVDTTTNNIGRAYIYNVQSGQILHILNSDTTVASAYFGEYVDINSNYAIVGSSYESDDGDITRKGFVYIFNTQTGTKLHKLSSEDAFHRQFFGKSVAISDNYAIIGTATGDTATGPGSAYIFNVQSGTQLHKLTDTNGANRDNFGISVAISGNYAIVGAYMDDDNHTDAGSAFIYNVQTGVLLYKLHASDDVTNNYFGYNVDIDGNYAIVGCGYLYGASANPGAYIFDVQTGTELKIIKSSDMVSSDEFGYSVAISGNYAIIGSHKDDDNGDDSGSAYIFGPSSATPSLLKITDDIPNMVVNGNVGIGTTSPIGKLQVAESSVDGNLDVVFSAAMDANCRLILQRNHGTEHAVIGGSNTIIGDTYYPDWCIENNGPTIGLKFTSKYKTYPAGVATTNDVMFLHYEGNVGIGTTSPQHKLHVANLEISNTMQDLICLETQTSSEAGHPAVSGIAQGILFKNKWHTNETKYSMARISAHSQPGYGGQLSFWTNSGTGSPDDTLLERLRINEDGYVGIGTTDPLSNLHLGSGNIRIDLNSTSYLIMDHNQVYRTGGNLYLNWSSSTDVIICNDGNVGIGINNPETYKLYVKHDGTGWSSIFNTSKTQVYLSHVDGYGIAFDSTETTSSTYALNLANGDGSWCRAYNNKVFHIWNSGYLKSANIYGDTGLGYHASGYGKHNWYGSTHWAGNTESSWGSYGNAANWDAYGTHDFIYLGKIHGALISTGGFIHLSDERIKRDIEDVPDNESLNKVLEIEVRKYGYQDYINKGTYHVTGFIAQEVLKVFPEAVSTNTDGVLPNIYKITTGHNYDISENKLTLDVSGISLTEDIKIDSKIQLKLLNHETLFEEDIDVYLKEVNDTNIVVECNKNITEKIEKTQKIFIFGSYVNNIHTVNKDKIFTLHHGAIQEIHKEQQADKAKIAELEAKVSTLESTLETVLARLTALENN